MVGVAIYEDVGGVLEDVGVNDLSGYGNDDYGVNDFHCDFHDGGGNGSCSKSERQRKIHHLVEASFCTSFPKWFCCVFHCHGDYDCGGYDFHDDGDEGEDEDEVSQRG